MQYRDLGRTGWKVSAVSFGAWAIGGTWGTGDDRETTFAPDDHRSFNRDGRAFDRGETFSGVDFETGLQAVEELKPLVPPGWTMAQFALRWILMFDAVSCTIPEAKHPEQVEDNARAADMPPLTGEQMARVREVYDRYIREQVHHRW